MKAPDKIYIPNCIDTVSKAILTTTAASDDIEYIRKDLLLEWAKERYQQTISNVGCYTGHSVWEEVIQYIESL